MVVQEGNIRKTMAARGLVNGRDPRSGRDLVFRCYPPGLLFTPPQKKTEADLLGQPLVFSVDVGLAAASAAAVRLAECVDCSCAEAENDDGYNNDSDA